jgi:hypothetical protein
MKRGIVLIGLLLGMAHASFGQKEISEDTPWGFRDRAYSALGFGGLGFGTDDYYGKYFSVGLSAVEGYMLTKNMSVGIGGQYQFTSYSSPKAQMHFYGGYPFLRYNIKNFFVQTDYHIYGISGDYWEAGSSDLADRFFVGLGYFSQGRPGLNFLVSYDFLYTNRSPWASPVSTRLFFSF